MKRLFSERTLQPLPRVKEHLDSNSREGMLELVRMRIASDSFASKFPEACQDPPGLVCGTDTVALRRFMEGYRVIWPEVALRDVSQLQDYEIFDLMEFAYEYLAEPVLGSFHSFFDHHHLRFNQTEGREKFQVEINQFFARNGIAYNFTNGEITRLLPAPVDQLLDTPAFSTGDSLLDEFLENASLKFLNKDLRVRREALEKLWDVWERLKSLQNPEDKRDSVKQLLDLAASEPEFRSLLEGNASELTRIGNDFMIRHTEVGKTPVTNTLHIDYLFHRAFSMIWLLLKSSERL